MKISKLQKFRTKKIFSQQDVLEGVVKQLSYTFLMEIIGSSGKILLQHKKRKPPNSGLEAIFLALLVFYNGLSL